MERTPEPDLMDDDEQARQYAEADFSVSDQAFVASILTHLQTTAVTPTRILDLGCGPGNISLPLAQALPETPLLAIDGADAMLRLARERQRRQPEPPARLRFHRALLPLTAAALSGLSPEFQPPFGLLVSNSLLHHLQDPAALWQAVRLWGCAGARVVVRDLRRPDSLAQLDALVERHAGEAPDQLRRDFRRSLAAAYRPEEVERQLHVAGLDGLRVSTAEDRYLEVCGPLP
jgi:trans-aconitate 2-methyltransferase